MRSCRLIPLFGRSILLGILSLGSALPGSGQSKDLPAPFLEPRPTSTSARPKAGPPVVITRPPHMSFITFTNLNGTEFTNVEVIQIEGDRLFHRLNNGVCCGEAELAELPDALGKQFGYGPKKVRSRQVSVKTAPPPTRQLSANLKILEEILSDYRKNHTYVGKQSGAEADIFVCGDMACDVWNIVETKGIKARIQVGNAKEKIDSMARANHAWVMAEVSPDNWVAMETTAGQVVHARDNPNYYWGRSFANPKEFKEYSALRQQLNDAVSKAAKAQDRYNEMVDQYNAADRQSQAPLIPELNRRAAILAERAKDVTEGTRRLKELLPESRDGASEPPANSAK